MAESLLDAVTARGWTFAGADYKRKATKWRCPTGDCQPASRWIKADGLHPLAPRETKRWRDLCQSRAAVEREFGRLEHEYGLAPCELAGSSGSRRKRRRRIIVDPIVRSIARFANQFASPA